MIAKPNLTQADLVRRGIEHAIFNGDLAPGVFLEEGRLATLYGVSRTPVREAIANLAVQVCSLRPLIAGRLLASSTRENY